MPLVSVVIPAFNAEAYLARTVASAQNQTLADIEILIFDDASTDGTLAVGRRLARPILYGITLYFFVSAPAERRASQDYLARVFGRRPTLLQRYRHFLTFCLVHPLFPE